MTRSGVGRRGLLLLGGGALLAACSSSDPTPRPTTPPSSPSSSPAPRTIIEMERVGDAGPGADVFGKVVGQRLRLLGFPDHTITVTGKAQLRVEVPRAVQLLMVTQLSHGVDLGFAPVRKVLEQPACREPAYTLDTGGSLYCSITEARSYELGDSLLEGRDVRQVASAGRGVVVTFERDRWADLSKGTTKLTGAKDPLNRVAIVADSRILATVPITAKVDNGRLEFPTDLADVVDAYLLAGRLGLPWRITGLPDH